MKRTHLVVFTIAFVFGLAAAVPAAAQENGCQPIAGSLAATLQPIPPLPAPPAPPNMGWVGQAGLVIGKADPLVTLLVDTALAPTTITAHGMSGKELLTFSEFVPGAGPGDPPVPTGNAIIMTVKFSGVSLPVPFLGTYHAVGRITGTGIYADVTGNVVVDGQAMIDLAPVPRVWPFTWMAQIRGSICGVN